MPYSTGLLEVKPDYFHRPNFKEVAPKVVKMKGKHLVTGAAGMIGLHLVKRLVEDGCDVVGVDNLSSGSRRNIRDVSGQFEFVEGDCRDMGLCRKLVKGKEYVWSLAANMGGIGYITAVGADIMHDNAMINLNMLRMAMECEVPYYFYSSSACVYPKYRQTEATVPALKESDAYPAEPDEFYGWEKLFAEKVCEAYARDYEIRIRVARLHNVYGPAFTAFDRRKALRHPQPEFTIWGDGEQTRSFLYIPDCIEGMLALMDSNYDQPVNLASDRSISINDLAKIIIKISGKNLKPKHDLSKPQGVRGRNSDNTLVKQVLGWQPKVSLEVGLTETYHWAVEHFAELEGI